MKAGDLCKAESGLYFYRGQPDFRVPDLGIGYDIVIVLREFPPFEGGVIEVFVRGIVTYIHPIDLVIINEI